MLALVHPVSPPDGYPFDLESDVTLPDGTSARIRPIVPEDADVLADEILMSDPETLYLRFFTSDVRPDAELLRRLTVMDYRTHLAVGLVTHAGVSVGVARYGAIDDEAVEVAVSVKPEFRRQGVAGLLLDVLESAAAACGYRRSQALFLSHNRPAETLFARRGYRTGAIVSGVTETWLDLDGAPDAR